MNHNLEMIKYAEAAQKYADEGNLDLYKACIDLAAWHHGVHEENKRVGR